jgi:hypothetical protein
VNVTRYILHRKDGGVEIMSCVDDAKPESEIRKWTKSRQDEIAKVGRVVKDNEIPQDRTFRNAWTCSGKTIEHDMGKAREIHRDRLRAKRADKMVELDVAYMRADEAGDAAAKSAIAAKKQALRDVTDHPDIEAAKTTGDLKKVWPEGLGQD